MDALTDSRLATVTAGAGIAVIALGGVRFKDTAGLAATVVSACVSVVAGKNSTAGALPLRTKITQGARISVIAGLNNRFKGTSAEAVATVHRAWIIVVTIDGGTDADTFFAVVSYGAGVTVQTLPFHKRLMLAAPLSFAGINGAVVSIVTRPIIRQAVAIVVEAITDLGHRFCGGAFAQA